MTTAKPALSSAWLPPGCQCDLDLLVSPWLWSSGCACELVGILCLLGYWILHWKDSIDSYRESGWWKAGLELYWLLLGEVDDEGVCSIRVLAQLEVDFRLVRLDPSGFACAFAERNIRVSGVWTLRCMTFGPKHTKIKISKICNIMCVI